MQPPSFWKDALLKSLADSCVWHAVIPSIMVSHMGTWKKIQSMIKTPCKTVVLAQRANMHCAKCGTYLEDTLYRCAVRVLVAKFKARTWPDDGTEHTLMHVAVNSASLCFTCFDNTAGTNRLPQLQSNSDMMNLVLDEMESWCAHGMYPDKDGPGVWEEMVKHLKANHERLMQGMSKFDHQCGTCKNPHPKMQCSKCHYARYCNATCSHADWGQHKLECEVLQNCSLFFPIGHAYEFE